MPVVRDEQVELEILRALVGDVLAVDHHAEPEVPLGDVEIVEEAADLGRDREPALAVGGQLLEGQPVPVADLDGVAAVPGREQTQHRGLAEGGVHADFQRQAPAKAGAKAVDHLPEEGHGLLGIVDVARPVLAAQDVARLGEMSQQGVVAGVLAMVRIEAPKGPGHGGPGADDSAIDVDGQARQLQPRDGVGDEVVIELDERSQRGARELSQPIGHGIRANPQKRAISGSPAT